MLGMLTRKILRLELGHLLVGIFMGKLCNRSVPTDGILPHITYEDVAGAVTWLTNAFGFDELYRYGAPDGAQLQLGNAYIMLNSIRTGRANPLKTGYATQSLTVFVEDVDTHFVRAKSFGCKIVEDLHDTMYGERQYGVMDFEGHHWLFSQHVRDVDPVEWGATVKA
jgi:uncharacterized glyoxalase superfamily protein PhnB